MSIEIQTATGHVSRTTEPARTILNRFNTYLEYFFKG